MSIRMLKGFTTVAAVCSAALAGYLATQPGIVSQQDSTVAANEFATFPCMPKGASDLLRDSRQVHRLDVVACGYDEEWSTYY